MLCLSFHRGHDFPSARISHAGQPSWAPQMSYFIQKAKTSCPSLSLEKLAHHRSVQRVTCRVGGWVPSQSRPVGAHRWGGGGRTKHSAPCVVPSGPPSVDTPGEVKVETELWPETPSTGGQGFPSSGWSPRAVFQEALWPALATVTHLWSQASPGCV